MFFFFEECSVGRKTYIWKKKSTGRNISKSIKLLLKCLFLLLIIINVLYIRWPRIWKPVQNERHCLLSTPTEIRSGLVVFIVCTTVLKWLLCNCNCVKCMCVLVTAGCFWYFLSLVVKKRAKFLYFVIYCYKKFQFFSSFSLHINIKFSVLVAFSSFSFHFCLFMSIEFLFMLNFFLWIFFFFLIVFFKGFLFFFCCWFLFFALQRSLILGCIKIQDNKQSFIFFSNFYWSVSARYFDMHKLLYNK